MVWLHKDMKIRYITWGFISLRQWATTCVIKYVYHTISYSYTLLIHEISLKKGLKHWVIPMIFRSNAISPHCFKQYPNISHGISHQKNNISHHLQTISKYKPITVEFSTSSLHPEQDAARHRSNDWPFVTCDSENLSLATPRHLDLIYVTCDSKNRSLATQAPFRSRQEKGWGGVGCVDVPSAIGIPR